MEKKDDVLLESLKFLLAVVVAILVSKSPVSSGMGIITMILLFIYFKMNNK